MNTYADKTQEKKSRSTDNQISKDQGSREPAWRFADDRYEAAARERSQDKSNADRQLKHLSTLQEEFINHSFAKTVQKKSEPGARLLDGTPRIQLKSWDGGMTTRVKPSDTTVGDPVVQREQAESPTQSKLTDLAAQVAARRSELTQSEDGAAGLTDDDVDRALEVLARLAGSGDTEQANEALGIMLAGFKESPKDDQTAVQKKDAVVQREVDLTTVGYAVLAVGVTTLLAWATGMFSRGPARADSTVSSAQNVARNRAVLRNHTVGSGFSGVFRPGGGFLAIASGDATLLDGRRVNGVPRRGGHANVAQALYGGVGQRRSGDVGFALIWRGGDTVDMVCISGQINTLYGTSRVAPARFRGPAVQAVRQATGMTVRDTTR